MISRSTGFYEVVHAEWSGKMMLKDIRTLSAARRALGHNHSILVKTITYKPHSPKKHHNNENHVTDKTIIRNSNARGNVNPMPSVRKSSTGAAGRAIHLIQGPT